MITVYSKPGCGGCSATKQHLVKLGVPYLEVDTTDMSQNPAAKALLGELGYTGLPVVYVDSSNHWTGYRPDRVKALVKPVAEDA